MHVTKEASIGTGAPVRENELALINQLSRTPLKAEQVYVFGVRLCDNEIDRDFERFEKTALEELAHLFVGKSGIFDHTWSARNQAARIYRTELVREEGVMTAAGDPCWYLKGYAYMLRTQQNEDLIAEIEAGIKKEVSVGCALKRCTCSICGGEMSDQGKCSHTKGKYYNNRLCFGELREATDAFEWSFVAVPAQRSAGVVKGLRLSREALTLKALLTELPEAEGLHGEFKRLEEEARQGRRYLDTLRDEVVRLGLLAQQNMKEATLRRITDRVGEQELLEMKRAYEARMEELFPPSPQLRYKAAEELAAQSGDGAFVI